jgi:SulP family sulfate permease
MAQALPFLQWTRGITRRTLRGDLIAGVTGAIIVLPQGVAFAVIAGLPPEYGLYAAIVPTVIAALFGSSFHLISGPTTAISIVVATTISPLATRGTPEYLEMVLTLTFLAGFIQLALGLARLGSLTNFVSHSVVVGFTAGAAILIATGQLGHFLGITIAHRESFLHTLGEIVPRLPETNPYVLAVAAATLLIAILLKVLLPNWPGMLIAMVGGGLLAALLDGQGHGVRFVGALPAHLPPLSHPDLSTSAIRRLSPGAFAVALLGLTEAVSIARSVAARSHQRIDSNQEFIGQGLSNLVGSFFSGYASSGSFTRTGVNYNAGAKTPLAGVFAALLLGAILLLVAPVTAYLPIPAMAGVLLLVAWNLIDTRHIGHILRADRSETAVLAVTFLATLFVELEFAVYVGVLLSLVLYLNRTSHPHFVTVVPDPDSRRRSLVNIAKKPLPECPQVKIIRIDGSIFFGAVEHVAQQLEAIVRESPLQPHLLIVGSGINFIDLAGCETLGQEARRHRVNGRQLYLCSLKGEAREILTRAGCITSIGAQNVFPSKVEALARIVPQLDPERCRVCALRIFHECAKMPAPPGRPGSNARSGEAKCETAADGAPSPVTPA